jgi:sugar lactone lactonase YvrE
VPPLSDLKRIASGFVLAEAPVVADDDGVCFAEVREGGVYRASDTGEPTLLIEHRRGIGGMAVHADGGFVVSGRNLSHKALDQTTTVLLDRDPATSRFLYNDLTTDIEGRVYVGTFATNQPFDRDEHGKAGALLAVERDLTVRVLDDDFIASNGMGFSPDGRYLYVNETGRHALWRYDIAAGDDALDKTRVYDFGTGHPDGMAVAEDGSIWVAMADAGNIVVIGAGGTLLDTIDVPAEMVASLCFGGPDRRTLYIVTGSHDPKEHVGGCFQARVGVPGVSKGLARLDLSLGKVERAAGRTT